VRHFKVRSSRVAFERCDAFYGQRGVPTAAVPHTDIRCVVPIETEIEKRISEGRRRFQMRPWTGPAQPS